MYVGFKRAGFTGDGKSTLWHTSIRTSCGRPGLRPQTTPGLHRLEALPRRHLSPKRCAGIQALIEGDAVLTETMFGCSVPLPSEQDIRDLMGFYNDYESPVFDSAPHYMSEDFMFPYLKGQAFVQITLRPGAGYPVGRCCLISRCPCPRADLTPEKYPNELPSQLSCQSSAPH